MSLLDKCRKQKSLTRTHTSWEGQGQGYQLFHSKGRTKHVKHTITVDNLQNTNIASWNTAVLSLFYACHKRHVKQEINKK